MKKRDIFLAMLFVIAFSLISIAADQKPKKPAKSNCSSNKYKYEIYTHLLKRYDPERRLYLAVPIYAYHDIFQRQVGQLILEEFHLNLIIYTLSGEKLIWKTS